MDSRDSTAVIAGGGPIGLLAGLGLARAAWTVTVLDAAYRRSPSSFLTLHPVVLPRLATLDVLEELVSRGEKQRHIGVVVDGVERVELDLGLLASDLEHPYYLHVSRHAFAEVVGSALAATGGDVLEGAAVTSVEQDTDGVSASFSRGDRTEELRAGWLVGSDGIRSTVRREAGIGFAGFTWKRRLVRAVLDADLSSHCVGPAGYLIGYGALVRRMSVDRWQYAATLPESGVADRMNPALPMGQGVPESAWASVRMHERVADVLRHGRVVLVGDAAQTTSPLTEFGPAAGVFGASALVDALTSSSAGARGVALDEYSAVRRRVFLDHVSPLSADLLNQVFWPEDDAATAATVERYRQAATDTDALRELIGMTAYLRDASIASDRLVSG